MVRGERLASRPFLKILTPLPSCVCVVQGCLSLPCSPLPGCTSYAKVEHFQEAARTPGASRRVPGGLVHMNHLCSTVERHSLSADHSVHTPHASACLGCSIGSSAASMPATILGLPLSALHKVRRVLRPAWHVLYSVLALR